MKKIFTSMFLMAAAFVASAQNFTVTAFEGTQTLKDGDVIECGYTEENLGTAENPWITTKWDPSIVVECNKDLTLTVTANAPAGHKIQFCGISGLCAMLTGTPETRSNVYSAGSKVEMQLDIVNGDIVEPVSATLKITDGTETVNVTVTFVNEEQPEASIKTIGANTGAVRLQGRTLNFNVEGQSEITLYSISGQTAISRRVSGQGSLNLGQLPAGVYIYRAGNKTGKLILR